MQDQFSSEIPRRQALAALGRGERGSALVLFSFLMVTSMLPMMGLAIDGGMVYFAKTRISAAVDAAALAGGRSLSVGLDFGSQKASAEAVARQYFLANYPVDFLGSQNVTVSPDAEQTASAYRTVTVTAYADIPLTFMRLLGFVTTRVAASAQSSRRDVNIVLTLDRSGSMIPVCGLLRTNAQNFVNGFTDGRDEMGLVTFMAAAKTDYSPTVYFKTSIPTISGVIGQLACGGNTGSAAAIFLAQQQVQAANVLRPGALKIIVFFTDGVPNGFSGDFPVNTNSTCNVPLGFFRGVMGDGGGLNNDSPPNQTISSPSDTQASAPNCKFYSLNQITKQLAYVPSQDINGNSAKGYLPLSLDSNGHITFTTTNSDNASTNAADNAARAARNAGTVIYTIGLGSNGGVDSNFLLRVANDPTSSNYDPTQPAGRYAYAADAGQLSSAFNSIQSEILRISQ